MSLQILTIGTAVPQHSVSQQDAADFAKTISCEREGQQRVLDLLYRKSGVSTRGSVLIESADGTVGERQSFLGARSESCPAGPGTAARMEKYRKGAGPLSLRSARSAIEEAGVDSQRITHLVTVSCSGFSAPGFDLELVRELPLRPDVARTHIGFMGCHGALNGLRAAYAYAAADPQAVVLVVATEICSLHYQYGWNPDRVVANSLFADGSAAALCAGSAFEATRARAQLELVRSGSFIPPETEDAMTWSITDNGFEMTLSARVPELIQKELVPWLDPWLNDHGLSREAVAAWAMHPGGPRILSATAEALGLGMEDLTTSAAVLREHGNMSSPTLLFIFDRLRQQKIEGPILALGFGPGLAIEGAILKIKSHAP